MKLTPEVIDHLAKLSRLDLTTGEKEKYAGELSVILDYVEMLNEVDTENVTETCQVTGLQNVVREDIVIECNEETKKKIIEQFPDKKDNLLRVKAVFN